MGRATRQEFHQQEYDVETWTFVGAAGRAAVPNVMRNPGIC